MLRDYPDADQDYSSAGIIVDAETSSIGWTDNKPVSKVWAIVLAAGAGSRFGGGKLFAKLNDKPLVEHVLGALEASPVDRIVVVAGDDAERMRETCEPYGCGARVIENPDWRLGQSISVRVGLRAMEPEVQAAVVLLGDQPLAAGAVGRLADAFEGGAKVVVASYDGNPRNPVLFSREMWPLLLEELSGDEGARGFIRRYPELVTEVPCDDVADPVDVDTVEDLWYIKERAAGGAASIRRRS